MPVKVTEGLTEDQLRQWDDESGSKGSWPASSAPKDPPGAIMDSPLVVVSASHEVSTEGDVSSRGDNNNTDSEGESDEYLRIVEGDDDDNGLFTSVPNDDELSIAFSDIVLPTEEEDPFLLELAAEEAARTVEAVAAGVIGDLAPEDLHKETPKRPVPFSVHSIVVSAVERKRESLSKLTKEELSERLEKRLRPYMRLTSNLPPLRSRKRPNCLFLNHMGSRRPPPNKKRKTTPTVEERARSDMLKMRQTSPQKPRPVTVSPNPLRGVASLRILPKLLTDSMWEDDVVQEPTPSPETVPPPEIVASRTTVRSPVQSSPPPVQKEEGKSSLSLPPPDDVPEKPSSRKAIKVQKKTKRVSTFMKTKTNKELKVSSQPCKMKKHPTKTGLTEDEIEEAKRKEVFKVIMASKTPSPFVKQPRDAVKPSIPFRKKQHAAEPPSNNSTGTAVESVKNSATCSCKEDGSMSTKQEIVFDDEQSLDLIHEPLDPSLENSFQYVSSEHHRDVLTSLARSDDEASSHSSSETFGSLSQAGSEGNGQTVESNDEDMDLTSASSSSSDKVLSPARSETNNKMIKKTPRPPSFVTAGLPPVQSNTQRHRRISMPRPILLSPETDLFAPGARYTTRGPCDMMQDDHRSSASPRSNRRRLVCVSTPSRATPVLTSNAYYTSRRSSLPYPPLTRDYLSSSSPSGGRGHLVTPDALASSYHGSRVMRMESLDEDEMMMLQSNIPGPPLLAVHPHEGYHSPVGCRRALGHIPTPTRHGSETQGPPRMIQGCRTSETKHTPVKAKEKVSIVVPEKPVSVSTEMNSSVPKASNDRTKDADKKPIPAAPMPLSPRGHRAHRQKIFLRSVVTKAQPKDVAAQSAQGRIKQPLSP